MQIILNAPGIHQKTKEGVEKEIEEFLPRLKQLLFRFRPEEKNLRVHLAQQKNNVYRLTVSLRMPGKSLIVEREGHTLSALITEAKQSLLEQVKVQSSVVRKEHLRAKAVQQHQAVQEAVGAQGMLSQDVIADEDEMRDRFVSRLRLVLQDLYSHIRRLIDFAQLSGDLPLNHLDADEVVDDILARAYEIYRVHPEGEMSHSTLYQLAEEIFRDEIQAGVAAENKGSSSEPIWEASDLGEEILGFYQPEEILLYADILPDIQLPRSVQLLSEREQMQGIFQSLSQANFYARSAFLLNRTEGFTLHEIARLQSRQEENVTLDVEQCEEALIQTFPSRD